MEKELVARLKRVRKAAGLSQESLAAKIGLGGPAISDIENHKRGVSVGEFVLWCEACGVSPGAVMNGEPVMIEIAEPA